MPDRVQRDLGERIRTGIAGEFFVAGELSRRGWIATLTAKNTPDVDVLAARPQGDAHARLQVKTRSAAYRYAHRVARIDRTEIDDFVIFVDIGDDGAAPRYWVVPAGVASGLITNGQIRTKDIAEYENRWDLLDESA